MHWSDVPGGAAEYHRIRDRRPRIVGIVATIIAIVPCLVCVLWGSLFPAPLPSPDRESVPAIVRALEAGRAPTAEEITAASTPAWRRGEMRYAFRYYERLDLLPAELRNVESVAEEMLGRWIDFDGFAMERAHLVATIDLPDPELGTVRYYAFGFHLASPAPTGMEGELVGIAGPAPLTYGALATSDWAFYGVHTNYAPMGPGAIQAQFDSYASLTGGSGITASDIHYVDPPSR